MWIWLFVGVLIGGAVGACTMCLMQERHDDLLWQDLCHKLVKTDLKNLDLLLEIADLKIELEDERYRHDRVQDFCVKVCEQLDAAKAATGWIPVAEKEPNGECLAVSMLPYQRCFKEQLVGYVGKSASCKTGYVCESDTQILLEVTHWKPLSWPAKLPEYCEAPGVCCPSSVGPDGLTPSPEGKALEGADG